MAPVQVFAILSSTKIHLVVSPGGLTQEQLCAFSIVAKKHFNTKPTGRRKDILDFSDTKLDPQAATKILKWVHDNNKRKPTSMTIAELRITGFEEAVRIHQATHTLGIARGPRGDSVRDYIIDYVKHQALTAPDLAMILNTLSFDIGLIKKMKNDLVFKLVNKGTDAVPDADKIEEVCREHGVWEEMASIRKGIEQSMGESRRERRTCGALVEH
ncbi:uncharacterized protein LTR77_001979 [Saxophila tyrrhenica]|uniref:Uncharacterized protein n=1 Tax=Saxophila tyrrhenica TaxID=1690608 RepID=A0AAV9PI51_9PEZI|nr:hypothetical protein LTR77_001979 [Saxophila tyrrhenica]